jgi:hypothetical protein
MKLFLDFDGVIANTVRAVCELYNQDYSLYPKYKKVFPDEIDTWGFKELELLSHDDLHKYFGQYRFFEWLKPMPTCEGSHLRTLGNLYELKICTIGNYPNIAGKRYWLNKFAMYDIKYTLVEVTCGSKDKSSVDMSGGIIVDDSIENLRTSNADLKICYGEEKGWNREWSGIRCRDWKELMELLENIYKYVKEG